MQISVRNGINPAEILKVDVQEIDTVELVSARGLNGGVHLTHASETLATNVPSLLLSADKQFILFFRYEALI